MEKIKKYIPRIILLDTIIYALIIVALYFILSFFKLMFREWIYIVSAIIIMTGFVVGIIQLLLKIKKKMVKCILISIFIILLLLLTPMICLFGVLGYAPEHVVEKDGKKFVAYVNGFLGTYVHYYDYKNIFTVGNQKRIEEYYSKGGLDPIENKYGHKYNVERATYYDKDGNITDIKTYNENGQLIDISKEKEDKIRYNYSYGEIFKIESNTIYYGDVKEKENDYLSQEIPENSKIIDYESEKIIGVNNIEVGDYASLYVPTEETENAQALIIIAKKDFIVDQMEKKLLNKREFGANLVYYNETENYITVEIALEMKKIENMSAQPMYYFDLSVGDNTKTYLGDKENNPNSNYGYHLYELCTVELVSKITDLSKKYMVESIEFIAD